MFTLSAGNTQNAEFCLLWSRHRLKALCRTCNFLAIAFFQVLTVLPCPQNPGSVRDFRSPHGFISTRLPFPTAGSSDQPKLYLLTMQKEEPWISHSVIQELCIQIQGPVRHRANDTYLWLSTGFGLFCLFSFCLQSIEITCLVSNSTLNYFV